jgi:hypothetical protein
MSTFLKIIFLLNIEISLKKSKSLEIIKRKREIEDSNIKYNKNIKW